MEGIGNDRRKDWLRIALLIAVSAAIRFWLLTHTEVSARDSIGFMRQALFFEQRPWAEVFRSFDQMPGYPLLVLAVSFPARAVAGFNCDSLVFSAQFTSILASLLTIVPMYFTGKRLFGRNAGLLGAAMFQALPVCVQVTSDGLSEGVFFLFFASATFFAVLGLQRQKAWCFALAGVGIGLAYLTRPEGGELAVALAAVIVAHGMALRNWRMPARQIAALALGVCPFVATYVGATGHLTRKPTSQKMLFGDHNGTPAAAIRSPAPFAMFWDEQLQSGRSRSSWAATSLVAETYRTTYYHGFGWAVIGVWFWRRQLRGMPPAWLLLALAGLHALVLWRMAIVSGYLSERHTMLLAFLVCFWFGAAMATIGERLKRMRLVTAVALLAVFAIGLPSSVKPLHANRSGHRQAGYWLAAHTTAEDEVLDPYCWAHFYAGCIFREGKCSPPLRHDCYVVMEQSDNPHARLPLIDRARQLAKKGTQVYHWPEAQPVDKARIVIYRVPPGTDAVVKN
jgi:4-amino-4-deoxy-L-arabinose transferase-like glycosyltransferase